MYKNIRERQAIKINTSSENLNKYNEPKLDVHQRSLKIILKNFLKNKLGLYKENTK